MILLISILFALISGAAGTLLGLRLLHIFQLEGYRPKGFVKWIIRDRGVFTFRYALVAGVSTLCMLVFCVCLYGYSAKYAGIAVFAAVSAYYIYLNFKENRKTRLNFTKRMIRLLVCFAVLNTVISFILCYFTMETEVGYCLIGLMPLIIFAALILSHYIMLPVEILNNKRYVWRAKRKLSKNPKLIKIGITGSYGKTSVKSILSEILSAKFKVCASPASYNTPMGICKVVNNNLEAGDEILIAEMGARRRGDIAELTGIVKPDVAIITAIGTQHLETFKTPENIAKTKYEIIEGMSGSGFAVFNGGNKGALSLYEQCPNRKLLTGAAGCHAGLSSYYDNVKVSDKGSAFRLYLKGQKAECETPLLGEHNICNIVIAAAAAYELGVSISGIREAVSRLKPVEHRLQLVPNPSGLNIIDDAYNANPQGVREALKVLSMFGGKKIIVTPGMVELGDSEARENTAYGEAMAGVADYCILVGRNAEYLYEGLMSKNFEPENVYRVSSLKEAQDIIGTLAQRGDTVLFSNDLPDNY